MKNRKSRRTIKPAINTAELEATAEFRACTTGQQDWLRAVANGLDFTEATVTAFKCATRRIARVRSCAIRKSPFVRAALALLLGKAETDLVHEDQRAQLTRLLHEVNRNLRAAEPGGVAAQRLLSQKENLIRSLAADESKTLPAAQASTPPRFRVGDVLTQSGVDYEVIGLEPNGDPITREIGSSHGV